MNDRIHSASPPGTSGLPSSGQTLVLFAHGKESGPWGSKIKHLAAIAERLGAQVLSPDYGDLPDPDARVARLRAMPLPAHDRLVLVASLPVADIHRTVLGRQFDCRTCCS